MKIKEFKRIAEELDRGKYDLYNRDIAFQLIGLNKETMDQWNVGVGTGGDMTQLILIQLCNLYDYAAKKTTTIERFADSVAESLKKYYPQWKEAVKNEPISGN